jgi:hypothetical protein
LPERPSPRRRTSTSIAPFCHAHAQPRWGKASLVTSTTVGSEDRTGASPGELAVDQEQRSETPDVARSLFKLPTHKVSKKGLTSLFRCRRDQSHQIWATVARTRTTAMSGGGGAAVRCRRRPGSHRPLFIVQPTVTIRSGRTPSRYKILIVHRETNVPD